MRKKQKAIVGKPGPQKNRQTPEKVGLTFSEKKRLSEPRRVLVGNSKEQTRPGTAQKTIALKKMYRDGICQVADTYYTKTAELFDTNCDLPEVEDQVGILEEYNKLINYFDPSIRFQLLLFNRQVSEQALAGQFDAPLQDDDFSNIHGECTQMLKHQLAKGNNGIIKSKYTIFGVESTGIKEAGSKLNDIEKGVVHSLNNTGTDARGLDRKEGLHILHEYFNQGAVESFRSFFEELSESGKSVKDYIMPPESNFRYPSRFKSGSIYGSVSCLDTITPKFTDETIRKLPDIDNNLTPTMYIQTIDPTETIKMVKRVFTDTQKMKIEEQKKTVRSSCGMDVLLIDTVTYEKDTLELLDSLNTSNQKLTKMTLLITCHGRTKGELEDLTQRAPGTTQQANRNLWCLQYLRKQGLTASVPIGCNDVGIERNLITKSTAVLVPFCTQEPFMPAPATYYGLDALNNSMIMVDRKRLRTPNGVILGTSGSGKSFSIKRETLSYFLITKDDIIVCDPEDEYSPLVQVLHGQVVRPTINSKDYLNSMDIQPSRKGDKEALELKNDFLIMLCDLTAGGEDGSESDEKGIIDTCTKHIYGGYFKHPKSENMPILKDLCNVLLKYESRDTTPEMQRKAKQKAVRIANSLILYVYGSQNYSNHRTNVDANNRIMCFDIRDLGNQLKGIGMLVVQDAVWNRVSQNREWKVVTKYYCDEFHLLLKEKQIAIYSIEIWKRFRKWGGIPTGLTQNVGNFLKPEETEGILGSSDSVYLLSQNTEDQHISADELGLPEKQLMYVANFEPGSGLILLDNVAVPFMDKYLANTKTFVVTNTRPEESVTKGDGEG